MHRLFVALRPPAAIRQHLLSLSNGTVGARWQDDEQLHLTLAFIGEVERIAAEDVAAGLIRVNGPPPMLEVRGVGWFERRGTPHTLYAAVVKDGALLSLEQRIRRAITAAGVRLEARTFVPHITLARLGRSSGPVGPFVSYHAGLAIPPVEIDCFMLFESRLGKAGAAYEAIARYPLR